MTVQNRTATYKEVLSAMKVSRCTVIPLADTSRLSGLTEMADALGLEKPVLLSKTSPTPYDVESESVGLWISDDQTELAELISAAATCKMTGFRQLRRVFQMIAFSEKLVEIIRGRAR